MDKEPAKQTKCDGIRTSWPWKGYPCGAVAKYEFDGKRYCGAHYAKVVKEKGQADAQIPQWALNALDDAIDWTK